MAQRTVKQFKEQRERLNRIVMKYAGLGLKALDARTKEMLGLVASLALRCDDCIQYHIIRCHEENLKDEELEEALAIGVVVGGSITIPHLRRALAIWDELKKNT